MPASARAFAPASIAASSNDVPGAHQRRCVMPATRSSSLGGNFSRRRVEASLRSKSVELTIVGASTLLTESKAVLLVPECCIPYQFKPLFVSVLRSGL